MSLAPHCVFLREGKKLGDAQIIDSMIKDGLWDAFNGYHMGTTAENVAEKFQLSREEQINLLLDLSKKLYRPKKMVNLKKKLLILKLNQIIRK